jgi:hypothetical protein
LNLDNLLVGRKEEFEDFGVWIAGIPEKTSKSRVILARRKSGKTSFVQRLYNQLWSANGKVIPYYLDIGDSQVWYPDFAEKYFCAFASQMEQIAQLKKEKKQLLGQLSNLTGRVAEMQLANSLRSRKKITIDEYFQGAAHTEPLDMIAVRTRVFIQRPDGKNLELNVLAESACGHLLVVEVKKTKTKTGFNIIKAFLEKANVLAAERPEQTVIPAVLSLGGFTEEAQELLMEQGVAAAEGITVF